MVQAACSIFTHVTSTNSSAVAKSQQFSDAEGRLWHYLGRRPASPRDDRRTSAKGEERDRFEIETGFSPGEKPMEEAIFIYSAYYLEVRCNERRFKLGPIQAEVVRAMHEAVQAGEPWQNGKVILSRDGSKSLRMADVFKSQTDWRQLIRSDRCGGYRLAFD